ncbi:hypothetical protein ACH5RR_006223 [Cinchona calisaya]|uniref:G protein gamma domain-containing protein n=1 Tax=Cinchona calisaya TaxID=153742 RepID=A0ABD3AND6_9GENT
MAGAGGMAKVPSLPPPRPKSPPQYPDLYGKRRELAKVQLLEREIGFLEDELKFVEGLQPASRSCKEVADFVTGNSDPLMPTIKRVNKSRRFWKWLCGSSCFNFSWICRWRCTPHIRMPHCYNCNLCDCGSCTCIRCSKPKCHCCSCPDFRCLKPSCSLSCSIPKCPYCSNCCNCCNCSNCFGSGCKSCSCYPKCLKINLCSCCIKDCCYNCYNCYTCY